MRVEKCIKYKIDEETYTLYPVGNSCKKRYVLINDISYEVFTLLEEGKTIDETVDIMLSRYDVGEDEFRNDLAEILVTWAEYGIVTDYDIEITQDKFENNQVDEQNELTDLEIYDMMYQAAINENRPFKVYFEITHNCNLRCRHCYIQETVKKQENIFLDKDVIKKTIDDLKKMGTHEIVVTGGECTVHKDFFEIIKHICDSGLKLILLTNGNLINESFLEKIRDYPIADIRISIYGLENTHDEMTSVKGSFNKSFNALRMLRKEKGIGTAAVLATKDNFDELEELTTLFKENGIEYDFNAFIFPTTEQNMSPTNFRIDNVIEKFVDKYVINCSGSKCAAGISRFRVDPHGNVSPCDLLKHEKLGNIYEDSIDKIINSDARKKWLEKLEFIISNNECSKCDDKKFCSCCLGLIYMEHQDYNKKLDFLCQFTEAKKRKYQRIMGNVNV